MGLSLLTPLLSISIIFPHLPSSSTPVRTSPFEIPLLVQPSMSDLGFFFGFILPGWVPQWGHNQRFGPPQHPPFCSPSLHFPPGHVSCPSSPLLSLPSFYRWCGCCIPEEIPLGKLLNKFNPLICGPPCALLCHCWPPFLSFFATTSILGIGTPLYLKK